MSPRGLPHRIIAAAGVLAITGATLLIGWPASAGTSGGVALAPVAHHQEGAEGAVAGGTLAAGSAPSDAVSTGSVDFRVYLPPGYDATDTATRYPSLYLLHGRGDSDSAWTREKADLDRMIASGDVPAMIVVMPDAPWEGGGSWYVDSKYTGDGPAEHVETAITGDLVAYVDAHYRTKADRTARAVGGYSMGGFGALRYVLAHQAEFSAAIVLSAAVFDPQPPDPDDIRDHGAFGVGDEAFDPARYTALNYPALLQSFDPTEPVRVYLAVGDKEYAYPHPYEHSDLDFQTAVAYNQLKRVDGITADMRVLGGGHNWDVWQPAFVEGLTLIGPGLRPDAPQPMDATLFGASGDDWAGGMVPAGNGGVTTAYSTTGAVGDTPNAGGLDVAVSRMGPDGAAVWTTAIANSESQRAYGVAAGADGTVYVGGYTGGNLDGHHPDAATDDAFVSAIRGDGTVLWTTQFGDPAQADRIYAVAADGAGGVYVAGYTKGAVAKTGNAGDKDVFVARLDASGAVTWTAQFGSTGEDKAFAVTAFDGGVAVAGVAGDAMPGATSPGGSDGFVASLSGTGTLRWLHQVGSADSDLFSGLTVGPDSALVAVGQFAGDVGGAPHGGLDAIAVGYRADGAQSWLTRWGTDGDDQPAAVSASPAGGYLVTGATSGQFTQTVGGFDIFVTHIGADGSVSQTTPQALRASAARPAVADAGIPTGSTIQFGTQHDDGVSQWAELNLYAAVSGDRLWTTGATFGSTRQARNAGGADVFVTSLPVASGGATSTTTTTTTASTTTTGRSSGASGTGSSTAASGAGTGSSSASVPPGSGDTAAGSTGTGTPGSPSGASTAPDAHGGAQHVSSTAAETSSAAAVLVPPASGGGLSYTGIAAVSLLALAAALLAAGGALGAIGRRRSGQHLR